jgi:hypothetical protein
MKTSRTFNSPIGHIVTHRRLPVHLRFHLPLLPRWFGHRQQVEPIHDAGMSFEPGHERFAGNGFYTISKQDHDLEKMIESRTVMLMTIINR